MRTHTRHVLMCTGPRCTANGVQADAVFTRLGQQIDAHPDLRVKRTRSQCFAVCQQGPLMVVYPDGVWYRQVDAQAVVRIVEEHLVNNREVSELVFHRTGLGDVADSAAAAPAHE